MKYTVDHRSRIIRAYEGAELVGEAGYCDDPACHCAGVWSYWGVGVSHADLDSAEDFPVIGSRVEAGEDADHDIGTVIEPAGEDAQHPMNDGAAVYVAWDSGVRTWVPVADLY